MILSLVSHRVSETPMFGPSKLERKQCSSPIHFFCIVGHWSIFNLVGDVLASSSPCTGGTIGKSPFSDLSLLTIAKRLQALLLHCFNSESKIMITDMLDLRSASLMLLLEPLLLLLAVYSRLIPSSFCTSKSSKL